MRPRSLAVLALVVQAACVSTNAAVLNPTAQHAPICPNGVKLFTDSSKVGSFYEEVAVLSSSGSSDYTNEQEMYNSQRKKAAQLGANGVIIGEQKEPSTGARIASAIFGTSADRKGKAVAIYIPADSVRVNTACNGPQNR